MDLPSHTYRCLCGEGMHVEPFEAGRLARCPRCKQFVVVPRRRGDVAKAPVFDLSTPRLEIGLATRRHWREIHAIDSDPRNYEFEISSPSSERETKRAIKSSAFPSGFAKSNELRFRVGTKDDGRTVGTISASFAIPYYSVYIGLMIGKDDQGKGFGTESLSAVCDLLHDGLKVERIAAMCDAENLRCQSLLKKVGFKQEGYSEKFFHHPDRGWLDSPTYSSLRTAGPNSGQS